MRKKIPRRGVILARTSKSQDFSDFFLKKILPQKIRVRQRCEYAQKKALEKLHKNNHNSWNKKSLTKRNFGPSLQIRYSDLSIEKL